MSAGAALRGIGHAVPATVVSNATIAARLGVDEAWLERRSGTRARHHLAEGERLSDLAASAAADALAQASVTGDMVDMVVVGTTSSDEMSPHTAALVAGALGANGAAALDVSAACTGFLTGLSLAAGAIEAGRASTAVVIGADGLSRFMDADDRDTAMLFGDGAGAAVLTATRDTETAGIGPVALHSDPEGQELIRLARGEQIRMDGRAVFRRAVEMLSAVTREAVAAAGVALDEIDLYVYHQANGRIIRAVGAELGLDDERVVDVVARFANTSAASLPIALSVAQAEGRLAPGDRVLLAAFGAGLVWGGGIVRWDAPAAPRSAASASAP